jgi:hypothetical protein
MSARARRAVGIALVALTFAVAAIESGLTLHADLAIPLWDKPMHAMGAFGLTFIASPSPAWRRAALVAVLGTCVAWEVIQFVVEPFQGHAPLAYVLDTLGDLLSDVAGALFALRAVGPTPGARVAGPRFAARRT